MLIKYIIKYIINSIVDTLINTLINSLTRFNQKSNTIVPQRNFKRLTAQF